VSSLSTPCCSSLSNLSLGDEKILRVFDAPATFVQTLAAVSGGGVSGGGDAEDGEARALAASVPALGLSNKTITTAKGAIVSAEREIASTYGGDDGVTFVKPEHFSAPPVENSLLKSTLWPEIHKLYGHGNDLVCVASNHAGTQLASGCRATAARDAALRLWSTDTWTQEAEVSGHGLSVIQLCYSHSDRYLLSVSRDRSICVHDCSLDVAGTSDALVGWQSSRIAKSAATGQATELFDTQAGSVVSTTQGFSGGTERPIMLEDGSSIAGSNAATYSSVDHAKEQAAEQATREQANRAAVVIEKAHARIIWSCAWSHDDALFATGGRDTAVKLWRGEQASEASPFALGQSAGELPRHPAAVTAVAWAPRALSSGAGGREYLLAVGLENGAVSVWRGRADAATAPDATELPVGWRCAWSAEAGDAHSATVRRLQFRPLPQTQGDEEDDEEAALTLASVSVDHSVRIYRLEEDEAYAGAAEAACGQCLWKMSGQSASSHCDLAVRVGDRYGFVEGSGLDDHGDAHADDGLCCAVRRAEVSGVWRGARFVAIRFELQKLDPASDVEAAEQ